MSDRDRGSATAELAIGLPAVVLLLLAGLTAVSAVLTQLRCVDAARDAALAASRGEDGVAAGRRSAPAGATVSVAVGSESVQVRVSAPVHPLGARVPGLTVTAESVAAIEPGLLEPAGTLEPLGPFGPLEPSGLFDLLLRPSGPSGAVLTLPPTEAWR